MSDFWVITLWIVGTILFLGLIRVLIKHPASFADFFLDIMFLDVMIDLITAIFESGGDGIDW